MTRIIIVIAGAWLLVPYAILLDRSPLSLTVRLALYLATAGSYVPLATAWAIQDRTEHTI